MKDSEAHRTKVAASKLNEGSFTAHLPPHKNNLKDEPRAIGVEIEYAGISSDETLHCFEQLWPVAVDEQSIMEFFIDVAELGKFKLELDSAYLKELANKHNDKYLADEGLARPTMDILQRAAEQLVPWEVVSPPIRIEQLDQIDELIACLREKGALGTRHALHHAFGLHLNPDLPSIEAPVIVNYLRAYFCLYDWIVNEEKIDLTRRLTPYINHFERDYIRLVVDWGYAPSQEQLIDDYLLHNPTRNRSLDMLPLFAFMDEKRVRAKVDDPRVNARPTFHYRLPNCDIDDPTWSVSGAWNLWWVVECLANDEIYLKRFCSSYQNELERLTHSLESRWLDYLSKHLPDLIKQWRA